MALADCGHGTRAGGALSTAGTSSLGCRERLFIVSYYLSDDTISVYEPPARNSGIMGGKFMERCRAKNPGAAEGELYKAKDCSVGAALEFRKHKFILIEADEYTLNYMENKKFPASDVTYIVEKIKDKFREQSAMIRKTFRSIDKDHSGSLDMAEFKLVLKKFNFDLTDQEVISVMRKFDPDNDGSVRYDEFCQSVIEDDYTAVEERGGGQVLHGKHNHKIQEEKQAEAQKQAQDDEEKQVRLSGVLDSWRAELGSCREEVALLFQEADSTGDGHCDEEAFGKLLRQLPVVGDQLTNEDLDLMLECFYNPDVQDMRRPMSLVVLDEALFS
eukprot:TRINITY_DN648_c0_g1_i10.p2 TRINITY_DN648_c0_g1~~TRINITY_DN648_c0_g1_i10.p2  ORF type:complete len:330 (-),score=111.01 TRINITY_DN648_c0_g1_i10:476-1465(-)